MESVRQRKLDSQNATKYSSNKLGYSYKLLGTPRKTRRTCIVCGCFLAISSLIVCYTLLNGNFGHKTGTFDLLAKKIGIHQNRYAVIIDAGSTGSRVLAFSFHESVLDGSIKLEDGIFIQNKPGLSSFSKDPQKGAEKVEELLVKAEEFVPKEEWARTPLAIRATAGLRLLPTEEANALLDTVRIVSDKSPFFTNQNSVAIMDGVDEGLYSWFTVNFLLDRIFGNVEQTVAALDLGGGSTQITFVPVDKTPIAKEVPDFLEQITILHHNMSVYTHSYLGLGLMASRKEILSIDNDDLDENLNSECINPIINGAKWSYGGTVYSVSGPLNPLVIKKRIQGGGFEQVPIVRMKSCTKIVSDYIKSQNVHRPSELRSREVTLFSYFYDRAIESGIIDVVESGTATVKDFQKAAEESCGNPNADQPFMCLDLTFISVLLIEGYGLLPETKLILLKKIDGQEVSWSLGAAFNILQSGL